MAKSIPALITPEVLVWARKLDAISIDEIAAKMKVQPQKLKNGKVERRTQHCPKQKILQNSIECRLSTSTFQTLHKEQKRLNKVDYRAFWKLWHSEL